MQDISQKYPTLFVMAMSQNSFNRQKIYATLGPSYSVGESRVLVLLTEAAFICNQEYGISLN